MPRQKTIQEVDELNESARNVRQGELSERLRHADTAMQKAKEIDYTRGLAYGHRNRGSVLKLLSSPATALPDLQRALELFQSTGDIEGEASAHTELGICYQDLSDYASSFKHLLHAKQVFSRVNDEYGVARTDTNIGNLYLRLEQYSEAAELFQKAFAIHQRLNKPRSAARAKCNLGLALLRMGSCQEALVHILDALPTLQQQGLDLDVCAVYVNIGEIYLSLSDYDLAEQYLERAMRLATAHQFRPGEVSLTHLFGRLELVKGNIEKAIEWHTRGLALCESMSATDQVLKCLAGLSDAYEAKGEYQTALELRKRFIQQKNEVLSTQFRSVLNMREIAFRREQADHETRWLQLKNIELENINLELAQMNDHKDDILRIVSHDMRTPLGTIIGMGNLLRTEGVENAQEAREMGSLIEESGLRLLNLVNGLLETAHADSGAFQLNLTATDIAAVMTDTVRLFEPMAERKNVQLVVEHAESAPSLQLDSAKIGQVMANVLSNAIKFTQNNGSVTLRSRLLASELVVEVQDTGIGIPTEHLPHVFEKFGKHQRRGTAGERGTGLGMPIVKRFVELHGGRVEVSSREGDGTLIRIFFPIRSA